MPLAISYGAIVWVIPQSINIPRPNYPVSVALEEVMLLSVIKVTFNYYVHFLLLIYHSRKSRGP